MFKCCGLKWGYEREVVKHICKVVNKVKLTIKHCKHKWSQGDNSRFITSDNLPFETFL